jgi:tripartite-type tricarboxylate transporter receptor subunit TctC
MIRIASLLLCCSAVPAYAQTPAYPSHPVRIIVATAAGSGVDVATRIVAPKLSGIFGQQFVIENRAGAAGNLAGEAAARAAPDGHTLLMIPAGMTINTALYSKLSYNLDRDFEPVVLLSAAPLVLAIHPSLPVRSVRELVAFAKARPGSLSYASSGNGSSPHLSAEIFKMQMGLDIVHVPYKGSPQGVIDLLAGEVSMMMAATSSLMPHVQTGRVRALAVSSRQRTESAAGLPTIHEAGVTGYEAITWAGLVAPAGVSKEIVERLNREVVAVLRMPDVRMQLAVQKLDPLGGTPQEFRTYLRAEIAKWGKVVKAVGARVD